MGTLRAKLGGNRLWGANIVPKAANIAADSGRQSWAQMILNWDWSGWVKPQIDSIVGNGVGANAIRMIGAQWGVVQGFYTQDFYDAKMLQVVDYCASLGVYFCAVGGDFSYYLGGGVRTYTLDQAAASMAITMRQMQRRPNVVTLDVIQEVNNSSLTLTELQQFIAALKASGITLPMTYSWADQPGATVDPTLGNATYTTIAPSCDFLEFHPYFVSPVLGQYGYYRTNFPTRDILIGECGRSQADGAALIEQDLMLALRIGDQPDQAYCGTLIWACADQSVTNTDQWGLYDATFVPRQYALNCLRRYTGGSLAKSLSGHR
jgi:hypothetical protein